MKNRKDRLFFVITVTGALGVGACLVLSELVFPMIEELSETPPWYLFLFCASFLVAGIGMVGGVLTKSKTNTKIKEVLIEAALLFAGFLCMLTMSLSHPESRTKDIILCIGGALFALGFFCAIPSVAGLLKKPSLRQTVLSGQSLQWNKMMRLYGEGKLFSPLYELIDYQGGVYGEGHHCYFDNTAERLGAVSFQLDKFLPDGFRQNFGKALASYLSGKDTESICWDADTYFYQNGKAFDALLSRYADGLDNQTVGHGDALAYNEPLFQWGISGGEYLEFQYCEKTLPSEDIFSTSAVSNWANSSLFVCAVPALYAEFAKHWLPYFEKAHLANGQIGFDKYGINYYTKKDAAQIYRRLQTADGLPEKERFSDWLRAATEQANGFYLLGL